jgi:hypothetical protein
MRQNVCRKIPLSRVHFDFRMERLEPDKKIRTIFLCYIVNACQRAQQHFLY